MDLKRSLYTIFLLAVVIFAWKLLAEGIKITKVALGDLGFFALVVGIPFLAWGLLDFFHKPVAEWNLGNKYKSEEERIKNIRWTRYYWTPLIIFFGILMLWLFILVITEKFLSVSEFWFSTPLLFLSLLLIICSILLAFSKKFNNLFWKYVWHYDSKKEKSYMIATLLIFAFGLIFSFYLFSGIALYWP